MSNISKLIIAMLDDCGGSYFYTYNYEMFGYNAWSLEILGKDLINVFRRIMRKSEYMKYLNVTEDKNRKEIYIVTLNDLGNKERNNIENLFRLKGLLK